MKFEAIFFIAVLVFTIGCNSGGNQEDKVHENDMETHSHEGEEHSHDHKNGEQHHEQEEFIVGEDTTAIEDHQKHDHTDGHNHHH